MNALGPIPQTSNPWNESLLPIANSNNETKIVSQSPAEPTEASSFASSSQNNPFEALVYEVMSILIQEEEKATLILRDALTAERKWQKLLADRLEQEHNELARCDKNNSFARKLSDVVMPAALCAAGVASMVTSGSFAALPIGAVALGAVMTIDTMLLNDRIKQQVANWLGRGSNESTKEWFQRICIATNLCSMGLAIPLHLQSHDGIEFIGKEVAQAATQGVSTQTEYSLNQQKARLTQSEHDWEGSNKRLRELFGDVDLQIRAINSLYSLLDELVTSTSQASSRIFR